MSQAAFVGLVHQAPHFGIDLPRRLFGEVAVLGDLAAQEDLLFLLAEGKRAEAAHAVFADHLAGQVGGALDVVARAGRHLLQENLLGDAAAHQDGELRLEIIPGDGVLVVFRQLHRHAQRHTARDDGDLVQRIGVIAQCRHQRVAGLVIRGHSLLFVSEQHGLALGAHQDLVLGLLEVEHEDLLAIGAGSVQSCFVDHVGQVGAGETGCAASQNAEIDIIGNGHFAGVDAKDFLAAANVRSTHDHAPVKSAGAQQRGIEHIGTVGGRDQDDAIVGFEAVHLDEQLVQGLLALVVSTAEAGAAMAADRVDFVDEDDAGGVLLALLEEVADAAGADADEHLDEVRAGDGEERNIGLAGDGPGEQGFAGSRRPDEQHALGNAAARASGTSAPREGTR